MVECDVPTCDLEATSGESWSNGSPLEPVTSYRQGIEMKLTVRDLAVTLALCPEHTRQLADAGWAGVLETLARWDWRPL